MKKGSKRKKKTGRCGVFRALLAFFLCTLALSLPSFAEETASEGAEERLGKQLSDLLSGSGAEGIFSPEDGLSSEAFGTERLFDKLREALAEERAGLSSLATALAAFCFLSVFAGACTVSEEVRPYLRIGAALFSLFPVWKSLFSSVGSTLTSVRQINSFFGDAVPLFCAVELLGGGSFSASAEALGMGITSALINRFCESVMVPLIRLIFAFSLLAVADRSDRSRKLAERGCRFFFLCAGALSALGIGMFALQTLVASAKDRAALRAAKYAASLLPAVGSTLSALLSSLTGALGYLKSAAGASVSLAILGMLLSPLVPLLAGRFLLFCACTVLDLFGDREGEALLSPFCKVLDATVFLEVLSGAVWILEIVIFLKSGVTV